MDQLNDSDTYNRNSAMLTLNTYENIIDQIRSSGLNFQLQMSPFSAQISLKQSLVKERCCVNRLPLVTKVPEVNQNQPQSEKLECVITKLTARNLELEKMLETLKCDFATSIETVVKPSQTHKLTEMLLKKRLVMSLKLKYLDRS